MFDVDCVAAMRISSSAISGCSRTVSPSSTTPARCASVPTHCRARLHAGPPCPQRSCHGLASLVGYVRLARPGLICGPSPRLYAWLPISVVLPDLQPGRRRRRQQPPSPGLAYTGTTLAKGAAALRLFVFRSPSQLRGPPSPYLPKTVTLLTLLCWLTKHLRACGAHTTPPPGLPQDRSSGLEEVRATDHGRHLCASHHSIPMQC